MYIVSMSWCVYIIIKLKVLVRSGTTGTLLQLIGIKAGKTVITFHCDNIILNDTEDLCPFSK